jgi:molybdenum cofactor cytidylyltransferase
MIAAIVLAAGLSRRMGQAKLLLPWGQTSVIGHVVETVIAGKIEKIVVVAGENQSQLEKALKGKPVEFVFNPNFSDGEMLESLQAGLISLPAAVEAVVMVLGDQPQMRASTLEMICAAFQLTHARLVIPSYQLRRGHPWLIERSLWPQILALRNAATLRDFIKANEGSIYYQGVDTPTILKDLDTPEDYQRDKPD